MGNAPHAFGYAGRFLFRLPGGVCFRHEVGALELCESHSRMMPETIIRVLQDGLIGRLLTEQQYGSSISEYMRDKMGQSLLQMGLP